MYRHRNYGIVSGVALSVTGTEIVSVGVMDDGVVSSATLVAYTIRGMRGC